MQWSIRLNRKLPQNHSNTRPRPSPNLSSYVQGWLTQVIKIHLKEYKDCWRKTDRKDRTKFFFCFLRLESKDKSKTGGGKLQRKQGLEKQLRHHSAAVQTGGKWKYTKTDRWTLTKQRHVIPKFHALETFNSPFSFRYFTCSWVQ